ncbi:MAG: type II toxin-antitoxin system VapC family toxin [Lentimonas sp.]
MKLLLDTCALLWTVNDPNQLSGTAKKALIDPSNSIHVSTISFWEISLKASIGKLQLEGVSPIDFPDMIQQEGWDILPLEAHAAASFHKLPVVGKHKDPFDRMLIHIAIQGGYNFVSKDTATKEYREHKLKVCW